MGPGRGDGDSDCEGRERTGSAGGGMGPQCEAGGPAASGRVRRPDVSMEPSGGRNSFVNRGKCDGATGPPSREVLQMAEQTGHVYVRPGGRTAPGGGAE